MLHMGRLLYAEVMLLVLTCLADSSNAYPQVQILFVEQAFQPANLEMAGWKACPTKGVAAPVLFEHLPTVFSYRINMASP